MPVTSQNSFEMVTRTCYQFSNDNSIQCWRIISFINTVDKVTWFG